MTGSLHLGHALTATIQDILMRWKRMSGFNCLWVPGTDHAGIATQMVVERELMRTEKKSRHDLGREEFLRSASGRGRRSTARASASSTRCWAPRSTGRGERFTMDAGLSNAVKEVFVRLHEEGLIYRARRLINWDPQLLTALSDLEVDNEERDGSLWSIAYPVKDSTERLVVATTRPETMLGDTAVAVHPEDRRYKHLIGQDGRAAAHRAARFPIIGDAMLVDPAVRHRRGEGDAGARSQRLRDRAAPRPADGQHLHRDGLRQRERRALRRASSASPRARRCSKT